MFRYRNLILQTFMGDQFYIDFGAILNFEVENYVQIF
jgi:hypothetical protein